MSIHKTAVTYREKRRNLSEFRIKINVDENGCLADGRECTRLKN